MTSHARAPGGIRRARYRWLVHLGLIGTVAVSLVFEPLILAIHIAVGLAFAVLAGMHLVQRRRVSAGLLARLARLLVLVTVGMLVSGFWDWFAAHPTKIRWHAITGVVLAILLLAHTVRRRRRLRRSAVR